MESLSETQARTDTTKKEQRQKLEHRLSAVRNRMDEAYSDKLDGVISAEFWQRKTAEWHQEEQQILLALQGLEQASTDMLLTAKRTFELANKAYFLYVTQKPEDQAKLLKMVLSNCRIDDVSLYPTYRKPFDLIFQRAKTKDWRRERDSNPRCPLRHGRFRGVWFQPLTHLSGRLRVVVTILTGGLESTECQLSWSHSISHTTGVVLAHSRGKRAQRRLIPTKQTPPFSGSVCFVAHISPNKFHAVGYQGLGPWDIGVDHHNHPNDGS